MVTCAIVATISTVSVGTNNPNDNIEFDNPVAMSTKAIIQPVTTTRQMPTIQPTIIESQSEPTTETQTEPPCSPTSPTGTEREPEEAVSANTYCEPTLYYSEQDAIDLAKVLWRECGGVQSKTEQACVAWVIMNRVDYYNLSIHDVISSPYQFEYIEDTPVYDDMLELAYDVLYRWSLEKNGIEDSGRVLPRDYMYFSGYDGHNFFRNSYEQTYSIWDYSLDSPYED